MASTPSSYIRRARVTLVAEGASADSARTPAVVTTRTTPIRSRCFMAVTRLSVVEVGDIRRLPGLRGLGGRGRRAGAGCLVERLGGVRWPDTGHPRCVRRRRGPGRVRLGGRACRLEGAWLGDGARDVVPGRGRGRRSLDRRGGLDGRGRGRCH